MGTGGGIKIQGGPPVNTRNVIEQNGSPFGPSGAAVFVGLGFGGTNDPVISYNVIREDEGLFGGALYLGNADGARVTGNLFVGNVAYYGGGLFLATQEAIVANNVIVDNATIAVDIGCGGGVYDPVGSTFKKRARMDNHPNSPNVLRLHS